MVVGLDIPALGLALMPALAWPLKVKPLKKAVPPAYQLVTAGPKSWAGLVQAPCIRDCITIEKFSEKIGACPAGRNDESPLFIVQAKAIFTKTSCKGTGKIASPVISE